jgi:hypothetical protein
MEPFFIINTGIKKERRTHSRSLCIPFFLPVINMCACKLEILNNGDTITVNRKLLKYFLTLENMLVDLVGEPLELAIPILPVPSFITKPIMMWCIDACQFQLNFNRFDTVQTNVPFLLSVCEAVDWIDSEQLLKHCAQSIYSIIRKLSTPQLVSITRHKVSYDSFSTYYKREMLIYQYLSSKLPAPRVKPILEVPRYFVETCSSNQHSLKINDNNMLIGYGDNRFCQLGIPTPRHIDKLDGVVIPIEGMPLYLACGLYHSLCLTTSGLYVAGGNFIGQLAGQHRNFTFSKKWRKLEVEGEVLLMAAGGDHIAILTTQGLFTCGSSQYGQLGLGDTVKRELLTRVDFTEPIIDIRCFSEHMIISTPTHRYGCGRNDNNQLAGVAKATIVTTLTRLTD